MNPKPSILICGSSRYSIDDLLNEALPEGAIPENEDEDAVSPDAENADAGEDDEQNGTPDTLIRRVVETPVANFIEAAELNFFDDEEVPPENLSMAGYVKDVEAELRAGGCLRDGGAKIDVVWYCPGEMSFLDESERDFIRSAAGLPGALVVACPGIVSNRAEFKKIIAGLTGVAGKKRVVLAPSASSGMNFTTLSSGMRHLIEKTGQTYLIGTNAPDEAKDAWRSAWNEFFGEKIDQWQEAMDDSLDDCIKQAAGRAVFILGKPADVTLTDLVEEGIDLLGELVGILRGDDVEEDKPGKTALAHTAELKENIELMIYEIAACYGCAANARDVELVLRHSKTSRLPKDAAAITYAVGQVAKAVYDPWSEYDSKELLAIYREAKEEAMEMEFRPFDDDDPLSCFDGDSELDEKDFAEDADASGDETEDADASDDDFADEPADDVHEPADELPEDCRPGYGEQGNTAGGRKRAKD